MIPPSPFFLKSYLFLFSILIIFTHLLLLGHFICLFIYFSDFLFALSLLRFWLFPPLFICTYFIFCIWGVQYLRSLRFFYRLSDHGGLFLCVRDILKFWVYIWFVWTYGILGPEFRVLFPNSKFIKASPGFLRDSEVQSSNMLWALTF